MMRHCDRNRMMERVKDLGQSKLAEELTEVIASKLKMNRSILERSLDFGRVSWRRTRNGSFEVKLELKV